MTSREKVLLDALWEIAYPKSREAKLRRGVIAQQAIQEYPEYGLLKEFNIECRVANVIQAHLKGLKERNGPIMQPEEVDGFIARVMRQHDERNQMEARHAKEI